MSMTAWISALLVPAIFVMVVGLSAALLRRLGLGAGHPWLAAFAAHAVGGVLSGCASTAALSWLVFGSMGAYQVQDMNFVLATGLPVLAASMLLLPLAHAGVYALFRAGSARRVMGGALLTALIALAGGLLAAGALAWAGGL